MGVDLSALDVLCQRKLLGFGGGLVHQALAALVNFREPVGQDRIAQAHRRQQHLRERADVDRVFRVVVLDAGDGARAVAQLAVVVVLEDQRAVRARPFDDLQPPRHGHAAAARAGAVGIDEDDVGRYFFQRINLCAAGVAVIAADLVVEALKHQLRLQKAPALHGDPLSEADQRAQQQQDRLRARADDDIVRARVDAADAEGVFLQRLAQRRLSLLVAVGGQQVVAVDHVLDAFFPLVEVDDALVDALAAEIVGGIDALRLRTVRARGSLRQLVKRRRHEIALLRLADDIALDAELVIRADHGGLGNAAVGAQSADGGQAAAFFQAPAFNRPADGQVDLLIHRFLLILVGFDKIIEHAITSFMVILSFPKTYCNSVEIFPIN